MKKKINVGIIGKNFGQKVILKAFQKNKNLNVIAFSALRKPEKNIIGKNIIFYSNWKKMVNNKYIDAVVIASPAKYPKVVLLSPVLSFSEAP